MPVCLSFGYVPSSVTRYSAITRNGALLLMASLGGAYSSIAPHGLALFGALLGHIRAFRRIRLSPLA